MLNYTITGGADAAKFQVSSTGVLSFKSAPDFESPTDVGADNIYLVEVTAADGVLGAAGTLTSVQAVTVTVDNINNKVPVITSVAAVPVVENVILATTVTATDGDGDVLFYDIVGSGADDGLFDIVKLTNGSAALNFKVAPDFENPTDSNGDGTYQVQVRVRDGALGAPGTHVVTQNLSINVANGPDAPTITFGGGGITAVASVLENTTAVGTITATDQDLASLFTYSIVPGGDGAKFSINAAGALRFITAPDFETPASAALSNNYTVQVQVTDNTLGGGLSDVQTITVSVLNLPTLITSDGGGTEALKNVPENFTAVTTVEATDNDGPVVFSIIPGDDAAKFQIDSATGELRFITAPDYEAPGSTLGLNAYVVKVSASSGGNPVTQTLTVNVTDGVGPVLLDLNSNGLALMALAAVHTPNFDISGDGVADRVAWVKDGDGILAFDGNGDGLITHRSEIVFTDHAAGATTDMAALRQVFDANHDGVLDASDAGWSHFGVWQDANGDGTFSPSEFTSLDHSGIRSVGLVTHGGGSLAADGVYLHGVSEFTRADGTTGTAADATLGYEAGKATADVDPAGLPHAHVATASHADAFAESAHAPAGQLSALHESDVADLLAHDTAAHMDAPLAGLVDHAQAVAAQLEALHSVFERPAESSHLASSAGSDYLGGSGFHLADLAGLAGDHGDVSAASSAVSPTVGPRLLPPADEVLSSADSATPHELDFDALLASSAHAAPAPVHATSDATSALVAANTNALAESGLPHGAGDTAAHHPPAHEATHAADIPPSCPAHVQIFDDPHADAPAAVA